MCYPHQGLPSHSTSKGKVGVLFKDIEFGYADASTEAQTRPELLLDAFYDTDIANDVWKGHRFLLLGPKGAGKSAVAWRFQLEAERSPVSFVKILQLNDFSFNAFSKIKIDENEDSARYVATWKFLLYSQFLHLLNDDQSLRRPHDGSFDKFLNSLRQTGILPSVELGAMVVKVKSKRIQAEIRGMVGLSASRASESHLAEVSTLIEMLERSMRAVSSDCEFRIIIDGLDDLLSNTDKQYNILASLVHAVKRVNEVLAKTRLNAKVILLMRTDLYDSLPGTNLSKWNRDYGVRMEWYDESESASESKLYKLVNLRATISCGEKVNVVNKWLPPRVRGQEVEKYLLELTRHRPRDVIQLFNELKARSRGGRLSHDQVLEAEKAYSRNYLLSEMKDELRGILDVEQAKCAFDIVFSIRKIEFTLRDAYEAADVYGVDNKGVLRILRQLFECGAIGVVDRGRSGKHTTFKYRNPVAVFSTNADYIVHRGIREVANLIRGSAC